MTVVVAGNTVVDALLWARDLVSNMEPGEALSRVDPAKKLVLLTAHRRENFGAPIKEALGAIAELVAGREDVEVLYPVHPNPNVRGVAEKILGQVAGVMLCEPLEYFELVQAMSRATLVVTDSGGIQEEAPALAKPVLVLRSVTERPEAVDSGVAKLVGTDRAVILREISALLDDPAAYARMARGDSPYGDGLAAVRTVGAILGEQVTPFQLV